MRVKLNLRANKIIRNIFIPPQGCGLLYSNRQYLFCSRGLPTFLPSFLFLYKGFASQQRYFILSIVCRVFSYFSPSSVKQSMLYFRKHLGAQLRFTPPFPTGHLQDLFLSLIITDGSCENIREKREGIFHHKKLMIY